MPISDERFFLNIEPTSLSSFTKHIIQPNTYEESCAWLFMEKAFRNDHLIMLRPIRNVGIDGNTHSSFMPDTEELHRVKREERNKLRTAIGNVHTHVLTREDLRELIEDPDPRYLDKNPLDYLSEPSETDIKMAKRYRDLIRGIFTVVFPWGNQGGLISTIVFHDQFGTPLFVKKLGTHHNWRAIYAGGLDPYLWDDKKK